MMEKILFYACVDYEELDINRVIPIVTHGKMYDNSYTPINAQTH